MSMDAGAAIVNTLQLCFVFWMICGFDELLVKCGVPVNLRWGILGLVPMFQSKGALRQDSTVFMYSIR